MLTAVNSAVFLTRIMTALKNIAFVVTLTFAIAAFTPVLVYVHREYPKPVVSRFVKTKRKRNKKRYF